MGFLRIPVSLKVDDTSDFYLEFFTDLQTNRKLSSMILNLLELYFSDDSVRMLINAKLDKSSPYAEVHSHLERIQQEHNKTVMSTMMLANQTQGTIQDLERQGVLKEGLFSGGQSAEVGTMTFGASPSTLDSGSPLLGHSPNTPTPLSDEGSMSYRTEGRLEALERTLPSILEKLDLLLSSGVSIQSQPNQVPVVSNATVDVQHHTQHSNMGEATINYSSVTRVPETDPNVPLAPPVTFGSHPPQEQATPKVEELVVTHPVIVEEPKVEMVVVQPVETISFNRPIDVEPSSPVFDTGAPSLAVEDDEGGKPASFAKAFSSIKKK